MTLPTSITFALCAAIALATASAASHYVALGGNDANSGLWIIEAHDSVLRCSCFKNNNYGNPKSAGEDATGSFTYDGSGVEIISTRVSESRTVHYTLVGDGVIVIVDPG